MKYAINVDVPEDLRLALVYEAGMQHKAVEKIMESEAKKYFLPILRNHFYDSSMTETYKSIQKWEQEVFEEGSEDPCSTP